VKVVQMPKRGEEFDVQGEIVGAIKRLQALLDEPRPLPEALAILAEMRQYFQLLVAMGLAAEE
jgi:hypothetical protein